MNGSELRVSADSDVLQITDALAPSGTLTFAPASITFLAISSAQNSSCQ